jgi:hypothetical protein
MKYSINFHDQLCMLGIQKKLPKEVTPIVSHLWRKARILLPAKGVLRVREQRGWRQHFTARIPGAGRLGFNFHRAAAHRIPEEMGEKDALAHQTSLVSASPARAEASRVESRVRRGTSV